MRYILAALFPAIVCGGAQAALLGRAPLTAGGTDFRAYYDTALNVTWLADANLAATNSFGVAGICTGPDTPGCAMTPGDMNWFVAQDWIAAMNDAGYLGASNWRLPSMDVNVDGVVRICNGTSATLCRDNEFGYMAYHNGVTGAAAPGPFENLTSYVGIGYYGSATEYAPDPTRRWFHNFGITLLGQTTNPKTEPMYAWPVSPGDRLVVPAPSGAWLVVTLIAAVLPRVRNTARS